MEIKLEDYLSDDEKKSLSERLGLFQGDITVSQIRSRLQSAAMAAYRTSAGPVVLGTVGISTNSNRGSGYDAARLRGYLEIDEKTLDAALKDRFDVIRDLFGHDSDGDLIVDTGAAFALDALIKPYVETGGILAGRTSTLNSQITRQEREIESLERQLATKERDLRRQYGLMEGALGQLESTSSAITNYFQNSGSNR